MILTIYLFQNIVNYLNIIFIYSFFDILVAKRGRSKNMTNTNTTAGIQSLQVGINILEILAKHNEPLKFSEIQNLSGMKKSNLYKYLHTFTQNGIVYKNQNKNTFILGSKLIEWGSIAIGHNDFTEQVIPRLKEISDHSELTTLLAVPTLKGPVVSYIWNANYGINIGAQIGAHLPLESSTGKIFAAFEMRNHYKEWENEYKSQFTNTQHKKFTEEQRLIQDEFFIHAIEPLVSHVSSCSFPILNFENRLLGAITLVGFTPLVPTTITHKVSQFTSQVAFSLSEDFGYSIKVIDCK